MMLAPHAPAVPAGPTLSADVRGVSYARWLRLLAVCCFAFGAATRAFAGDACDDMPVTGQKVEWVGHDMVINGTPTQVALITFDKSTSQIADAFRTYWVEHNVATHQMHNQKTLILSALSAQCSYTLQLPPNQSAPVRGLFSAMRLTDAQPLPRALRPDNYPLPMGKVLLDMTSNDDGIVARTVQMSLSEPSLAQASAAYADQLRKDGWHTVAAGPAIGRPNSAPFGQALSMQKNGYRLDAAFTQGRGSTSVVINVAYE
ncbi:hypothetical protein [Paraburkholderia sp.]|uniref:hypothetical protein n=1 Tax=Paraburkholderia sp. TaxID=1926495 RepID=UPI0039E42355